MIQRSHRTALRPERKVRSMGQPKTETGEPEVGAGTRESRDEDPRVEERAPIPPGDPKAPDRPRRGLRKRLSI